MKSREARDAMVARVQAAHKAWPTFGDMPEKPKGDYSVPLNQALFAVDPGKAYVSALFAAAHRGEPIGRFGTTIVANKVEEPDI